MRGFSRQECPVRAIRCRLESTGLGREGVIDVAICGERRGRVLARVRLAGLGQAEASRRLFVKASLSGSDAISKAYFQQEVRFYRAALRARSVVPCLHASYDDTCEEGIVVLPDLTETHSPWEGTPGMLSAFEIANMIAALASLHVLPPRIGKTVGVLTGAPYAKLCIEQPRCRSTLHRFQTSILPQLPHRRHRRILNWLTDVGTAEHLALSAPRGPAAVLHNDPHECNFLYPRVGGTAYLVDWETWGIGAGASDLAYALVLSQDASHRRRDEEFWLREYHRTLTSTVNSEYSFSDMIADYRCSVANCLFAIVTYWHSAGVETRRVVRAVERVLDAALDWDCPAGG
jgi:hypothetical protein